APPPDPLASSPHTAIATAVQPPARSAPGQTRANQTRRSVPQARSKPCPRERSCRSPRQRTRSRIPMTRRFLHNGPWSSLDDAWSGESLLRCFDTISLRDDRLLGKAHSKPRASAPSQSAVASERLATPPPARYPIYGLAREGGRSRRLLRTC